MYASKSFKQVLAQQSGIIRRTACNDLNPPELPDLIKVQSQFLKVDITFKFMQPTCHGLMYGPCLFMYLF